MLEELRRRWATNRLQIVAPVLFFLFLLCITIQRCRLPEVSLPESVVVVLQRWQQCALGYVAALGLNDEHTALLQAMLLGWRQYLPYELRQLYSHAGASHILALSGLHLGILFALFNAIMCRVLYRSFLRKLLGTFMLVLMWMYVLQTGCSPSLMRAAVMTSLFIAGQMRASGYSAWHALLVAAIFILLLSPHSLYSIGFQLSFMAVIGIFLFYRPLMCQLHITNLPLRWMWNAICVSLAAQLGTMPLVAYYFHSVSLSSLLLSPLYIFLATAIMLAAIVALLFGGWTTTLVAMLIDMQHGVMRQVAALPYDALHHLHPDTLQVVFMYLGIVFLLPILRAMQPRLVDFAAFRLSRTLRQWPYLLASALCFCVCLLF